VLKGGFSGQSFGSYKKSTFSTASAHCSQSAPIEVGQKMH